MEEVEPLLSNETTKTIERNGNGLYPEHKMCANGRWKTFLPRQPGRMSLFQKAAFGLGHIYNDLCAAMWFSYTLLFLQVVLKMDSAAAGSMLLLGQIIDALATPIVGIFADKWGSKQKWHFTGTCLVFVSFPFIFSRCPGCWTSTTGDYLRWWMPFFYAIVITIFQCGWAIVQISHLAMIPALTENLKERSELTAIRYTASVCSSVTVYLITWAILHTGQTMQVTIGPLDDYKFRDVSIILTLIGVLLTAMFHVGLQRQSVIEKKRIEREKRRTESTTYTSIERKSVNDGHIVPLLLDVKRAKNFFKVPLLYQAALLYVASRLFNALSLVYIPLFLDERLAFNSTEGVASLASVPLVSYIASFFSSLGLRYKSASIGNHLTYFVGSLTSVSGCLWVALFMDNSSNSFQLYSVAVLIGAGSSITMIASLCITSDLIGSHSDQSAVVYSVVTFADKLITGFAVIIIEHLKCENKNECPNYYRSVLANVCGGSALLGIIIVIVGQAFQVLRRMRLVRRCCI